MSSVKFITTACLAALASTGTVVANPTEDMDNIKRHFSFDAKDHQIKIQSKSEDKENGVKDQLDFLIKLDKHGIFSQFQYQTQNKGEKGNKDDDYKAKTKLQVKVFKMFEWRDTDGDGAFDPADDEVVQSFYVKGKPKAGSTQVGEWKKIKKQRVHYKGDAAKDAMANITKFELTNAQETFGIVGHYAGAPITFEETARDNKTVVSYSLNSNAIKYDLWASEFPFSADDTQLALEVRFQSSYNVKSRNGKNAAGNLVIEAASEDANESAFFDWVETVKCDGENAPVVVTPIKDMTDDEKDDDSDYQKGTKRAFFALAPGKQCNLYYWDPDFGVEFAGNDVSAASMAAPSFTVAALMFAYLYR